MIPGRHYTFDFIIRQAKLLDEFDPWFGVLVESKGCQPIQTGHVTYEDLLSVPNLKNTNWVYIEETREGVSVFHFRDHKSKWEDYFDFEPAKDIMFGNHLWITPKGFPREQYNWE